MNIINRINRKVRRELKSLMSPKRECNVCNTKFRGNFVPIHQMYQENLKRTGYKYNFDDAETLNYKEYSCPYCKCSDRDRLYWLFLNKQLHGNRKYTVLDFAPAPALTKNLKNRLNVKYRSADLFMEGVDDKVDIMDMNIYPDSSFDVFICSHVLEHVTDDRKAMRELNRVLKVGGFGIAVVPIILPLEFIDEDPSIIDPDERWSRFGQDDHVRSYSKQGYIDRLAEAGFLIEQLTAKEFGLKQFILHGISPKSVLYIVRK